MRRGERSILQLYRQLVALRRRYPCLAEGEYEPLRAWNVVLWYRRSRGETRMLIGLNIADEPRRWNCGTQGLRLISTYLDRPAVPVGPSILLRANEGIVVLQSNGSSV